MAGSRARKPWDLSDNETLTSFQNWQSIVTYNLSLDRNWAQFLPPEGIHKTWNKVSAAHPNRGLVGDGQLVAANDRLSATQKNAQLELMLGYISGYASVVSRNTIVKHSTCLNDIWQKLREYYNFASTGAQFLDLSSIKLNPDEKHERLFQRISSFFDDSLLTVGSGIRHHGQATRTDEELTPTLENTIVWLWLHRIHEALPALIKQRYGPELRHKTLASIKPEISAALSSLLDELQSIEDAKVHRTGTYTRTDSYKSRKPRKPFKSCTLCKAAGRPSYSTHNLSECKLLPEGDRRALARSRAVTNEEVAASESEEDDYDAPESHHGLLDDPEIAARRVDIISSPALNVYFGAHPVSLTLDSGATSNMVRSSFARRVGMKVFPAKQRAKQADGTTSLTVTGEVHCTVTRGKHTFTLDGLVVDELEEDVLAGTPFLSRNDIALRVAKSIIVIKGTDIVHYGSSRCRSSSATSRRVQAHLCRGSHQTVLLPGEYIDVSTPNTNDTSWALEPRLDCPINKQQDPSRAWPPAQVITSIDGQIRLVNTREEPILIPRHAHICQVRDVDDFEHTPVTREEATAKAIPRIDTSHQPAPSAVSVDPDACLTPQMRANFNQLVDKHSDVFSTPISMYNGRSGDVKATVNMGPALPPQRKGRIPHYNSSTLHELQDKFDELERAGVFAKPEDVGVTVEYLNTSFLIKKPSGGSRLVTSFGEVGTYSKPQPSLMPNVDQVLKEIASWNFIIVTDLLQSFYQIPLDKDSMKYCGVATPYKGIRVYTRSAMGMPGSETCLEELMSRVLGHLIQEGRVAKLADDLYCGGQTPEEALANFSCVLDALQTNNLRLSARKTIICPRSTTILGWIWQAGTLRASPHRLSALAAVDLPKTVLGMRSFIGAYKVLSRVLPGYAQHLHTFDLLTAGRKSSEQIAWTEELSAQFRAAQAALSNNKVITLPRPSDTLWIVTDGSVKSHGIGATLYLVRDRPDPYLAGFFNAKLHKHQVSWLPCEVEALAIAAAIKHFSPYIIQSNNTTQVLTDSRPCIQAYGKLNRGEFSNSARVTTFLSLVNRYQVHLSHIAGIANLPSDYTSRNPSTCPDQTCQVCKFIAQTEESPVRSISVSDVLEGSTKMPFTSRIAWYTTQLECQHLRRVHAHLKQGTRPAKKANNIKDTKRYLNVVTLANDGLIVVREDHAFNHTRERTVVPRAVLDGLLTALHIRFAHPSQNQLKRVFNRYFFALDADKALGLTTANCHHCSSLKTFPKHFQPQSSELPPDRIGVSFAADVMRRYRQHILVLRETVSSYTKTAFIDNERRDSLRDALIILCADFMTPNDGGMYIRVDAAPAFQSLSHDPLLSERGITLVIGEIKNVNKNPVAERAIQELGHECLNVAPEGGPLSKVTLATATSCMNSRIRHNGMSATETWTQRDQLTGQQLPMSDTHIIDAQHSMRMTNHDSSARSKSRGKSGPVSTFKVGDLVHIKSEQNKAKCRDRYIVTSVNDSHCSIRKFIKNQFRSRSYNVKPTNLYLVAPTTYLGSAFHDYSPSHLSDSDSASDTELPTDVTEPELIEPEIQTDATTHDHQVNNTNHGVEDEVLSADPPNAIIQPPDPPSESIIERPIPISESGPYRRSSRTKKKPPWMKDSQWDMG